MPLFRLLACLTLLMNLSYAESTPGSPDPETIDHKIGIKLDQKLFVRFQAEENRLLKPQSYKGKANDKEMVIVELMVGGPFPGRVLVVHNHFGRTLNFRALERLKDKPEFKKVSTTVIKVGPGQMWCHFQPEQTPLEEAVLYQFSLSDEPLQEK
jgi:hypothetical protein